VLDGLREVERQRVNQARRDLGKENHPCRHPRQFARDARGVEANGSISQHRDEMQEHTTKAKAGKFGNHDPSMDRAK